MAKSLQKAIADWMADDHIFPSEALDIEMSGTSAWVVERATGCGLRLYASRVLANNAIVKAVDAYVQRKNKRA